MPNIFGYRDIVVTIWKCGESCGAHIKRNKANEYIKKINIWKENFEHHYNKYKKKIIFYDANFHNWWPTQSNA